jgi:hypothetical protein
MHLAWVRRNGDGARRVESPGISVGSASMVVRRASKVPQVNQPHAPEPKAALFSCRPLVGGSPLRFPTVAPFPLGHPEPIDPQVVARRATIAWTAAAGPPQVRQGSRLARPAPPACGLDRPTAARLFRFQALMASRERDRSCCDSEGDCSVAWRVHASPRPHSGK